MNKQAVEIKSGENIEGKSGHLTRLTDAAEPWLVGQRPRHHDEIELEWYREQFTDLYMTMDGLDDDYLELAIQGKDLLRMNRWPDAEYVGETGHIKLQLYRQKFIELTHLGGNKFCRAKVEVVIRKHLDVDDPVPGEVTKPNKGMKRKR